MKGQLNEKGHRLRKRKFEIQAFVKNCDKKKNQNYIFCCLIKGICKHLLHCDIYRGVSLIIDFLMCQLEFVDICQNFSACLICQTFKNISIIEGYLLLNFCGCWVQSCFILENNSVQRHFCA